MAGEIDVYQACPCGSGKKIKFCCQPILADVQRVFQQTKNNQLPQALQLLSTLEAKCGKAPWSWAWVKVLRSDLLAQTGELDAAAREVEQVLTVLPTHSAALTIGALLQLEQQGPDATRARLESALQHARGNELPNLCNLLEAFGSAYLADGRLLAARQHLKFAAQIRSVFQKEDLTEHLQMLMDFDRERSLPFVVRSDYELRVHPESGEPVDEGLRTAFQLADRGRWGAAAVAFRQQIEHQPQNPNLWYNAGLCLAWIGDEEHASEAFRAAAVRESDFETIADTLVLAQYLARSRQPRVTIHGQNFKVDGLSRVLTRLDEQPQFVRQQLPSSDEAGQPVPAAAYAIIDRPLPEDLASLTADAVPYEIGNLVLWDPASAGESAQQPVAVLSLQDDEKGRTARALFDQAIAGLDVVPVDELRSHQGVPVEISALGLDWHIPQGTPADHARHLDKALWQRVVHDVWPQVPQPGLNNQSPVQAAATPDLQPAVAAAIVLFESLLDTHQHEVDPDLLRSRLGLPPTATHTLAENTGAINLDVLRARRLEVSQLSDGQLRDLHALLTVRPYQRLTERTLIEIIGRPGVLRPEEIGSTYLALVNLCRFDNRPEEALAWVQKARQAAQAAKRPLLELLNIELFELMLRSEMPSDPQLAALAHRVWTTYIPKLPEYREAITGVLSNLNLDGPWNTPGAAAPAGAVTSGGIWTPTAEAAEPAKLWLPGQE